VAARRPDLAGDLMAVRGKWVPHSAGKGDYRYSLTANGVPVVLMFRCPCADPECTVRARLQLEPAYDSSKPSWPWDGNRGEPTLGKPVDLAELGHPTGGRWTLTAGVWETVQQ
jgi:hypothetical protein